jgi:hypothetical protein
MSSQSSGTAGGDFIVAAAGSSSHTLYILQTGPTMCRDRNAGEIFVFGSKIHRELTVLLLRYLISKPDKECDVN